MKGSRNTCTSCFGNGRCAACDGSGLDRRRSDEQRKCPSCSGSGTCSACNGSGAWTQPPPELIEIAATGERFGITGRQL